jgi:predicted MFS family arabinose efflux permease
MSGYLALLRTRRGGRTYLYIFLNAVFHSGVFTWLGVLLHDRFGLGEAGIGLALLGYGVPGLFLGPTIGNIVDRHGRRLIIPTGLLVAAGTAATLAPNWPIGVAAVAITMLSLGFDMTHPLFAGIATTLDDRRRGQAMGLNTFSIFFGLGCGSLFFGWLTQFGMSSALLVFAAMQCCLGLIAFVIFRTE